MSEAHGPIYRITSDGEAIDLLERVVFGVEQIDLSSLNFDEYPSLHLHLYGEKFHGTITPSVMQAIIGIQREINRAYADAKYGEPNARLLTREEREQLELEVQVGDGSSDIGLNFQELALKLMERLGTMSDGYTVVLVLGLAGIVFGAGMFKHYVSQRAATRQKEAEGEAEKARQAALQQLSAQETQRLEVVQRIAAQSPLIQHMTESVDSVHDNVLSAVSVSDKAEVHGVELDGEAARFLARNPRRKARNIRIDAQFLVTKVDSDNPNVFRVTVREHETGRTIEAVVQDETSNMAHITAVQAAQRDRKLVVLQMNARQFGDEIRDAVILNVEDPPSDEGNRVEPLVPV